VCICCEDQCVCCEEQCVLRGAVIACWCKCFVLCELILVIWLIELFASWQRTGRSPWGRVNQYKSLCSWSFFLSSWILIFSVIAHSINCSSRFTDCSFCCYYCVFLKLLYLSYNWLELSLDCIDVLIVLWYHCLIDKISKSIFSWFKLLLFDLSILSKMLYWVVDLRFTMITV